MAEKTEDEWKEQLTDQQFWVARQSGTERPFTGIYNFHKDEGVYRCVCCKADLFSSAEKFDAGCGWPSFSDHLSNENVSFHSDETHGMTRTEVRCSQCHAHLGHVFDDGPTDTKQRYCINSASLDFAGDTKADAGDTKADAGDTKADAGDTKADAGDMKTDSGETKTDAGDTKTDSE